MADGRKYPRSVERNAPPKGWDTGSRGLQSSGDRWRENYRNKRPMLSSVLKRKREPTSRIYDMSKEEVDEAIGNGGKRAKRISWADLNNTHSPDATKLPVATPTDTSHEDAARYLPTWNNKRIEPKLTSSEAPFGDDDHGRARIKYQEVIDCSPYTDSDCEFDHIDPKMQTLIELAVERAFAVPVLKLINQALSHEETNAGRHGGAEQLPEKKQHRPLAGKNASHQPPFRFFEPSRDVLTNRAQPQSSDSIQQQRGNFPTSSCTTYPHAGPSTLHRNGISGGGSGIGDSSLFTKALDTHPITWDTTTTADAPGTPKIRTSSSPQSAAVTDEKHANIRRLARRARGSNGEFGSERARQALADAFKPRKDRTYMDDGDFDWRGAVEGARDAAAQGSLTPELPKMPDFAECDLFSAKAVDPVDASLLGLKPRSGG
ncbi:uncharacterized protein J3D65DRAFT_436974 [Phyllosticta citribraziliensis]|uniref:Uncharacterized protein n=1 Tax=Phyllosticta citribraziliensis TaxID=989973 RepID=A0ABR1LIL8_9PEZI